MKAFIDTFRTEKMLETVRAEEPGDVYNEKDFVTEYASTNPGEDIAESFAFFVLRPKPSSSKKKSDQKMLFFFDYPELVKLRSYVRSRIE